MAGKGGGGVVIEGRGQWSLGAWPGAFGAWSLRGVVIEGRGQVHFGRGQGSLGAWPGGWGVVR